MKLIEKSDLLTATNTSGFPTSSLTSVLKSTLKLNKPNSLYSELYQKRNLEFIVAVLQELEVKLQLNEYELRHIPQNGPFITVSNHPYGGLDGLLLLKILSMQHQHFKVMGNVLLERIEPLQDYILPANPLDADASERSSIVRLENASQHLNNGHPVGIFPAGEVSSFNEKAVVQDRQWRRSTVKFVKNANVPVVPIYFHGNNSTLFHILGLINPALRTAKLPSEMRNKRNKKLTVRIGTPISVEEQKSFKDVDQYGRYLRAKTYALGSAIEVRKFYHTKIRKKGHQEEVVAQFNLDSIEREIKSLPVKHMLFSNDRYSVFCAPVNLIPLTLNEIGRLREITYREVGEGTNSKIDLDEYDLYYDHLFMWDDQEKKIVGSYRIGKGKDIVEKYGKKGFYTHSLFHMKKDMLPILSQSIELGRSFIAKEYQKKPTSLFMLWKGILYVLLKNPEYRYLLGPVTISNSYSKLSKSLIIDFIETNYFHHKYAAMIRPRKKFKVKFGKVDPTVIFQSVQDDINKLDKMIEEIEPSHFKMPVLFKKYLKQNARILGFNVDPRFNNAVDGLMILDLSDLPLNMVRSLSKEFGDKAILQRFEEFITTPKEYEEVPQL